MAKRLIATLNDSTLFLREWLANPQRTGAVAPSSPKLAAAMARWLPSDPESYVLELGPGTGAVTQALIQRGLREDRLVAIENNPKLARLLRKRFPAPTSSPVTRGIWTFCCGNTPNPLNPSARSFPACRC
jgi:phosphatidylethanolamine/phosphatidyl-N-methylethanolamine N-methyltransferase